MRKLNILKTVLDIFWVFSAITLIFILIYFPFYLFNSDMNIPIKIKGQEITSKSNLSKIILLVNIISGLFYVYAIYLLRKVVSLFQKREIFIDEVVKSFDLIGKLIIASSIISSLSMFYYKASEKDHFDYTLDLRSNNSILISIVLGLFFMVISEIFKIAKNMKEESELTI